MAAPLISFALGAAAASAGFLAHRFLKRKEADKKPQLGLTVPTYVRPPHPDWKPGQRQTGPGCEGNTIDIDPLTYDKSALYALVISCVVPRPVAFVSTVDSAGRGNLAPYSYFNTMGHNPFLVAIGTCRSPGRGGGKKDTCLNIEETGEFVVNIISDWFVEASNHCAGEFDHGVDEMALSGLTPVPSTKVKPPRVKESAVQLECKLRHIYPATNRDGVVSSEIIIGEVIMIHINEAVADKSPSTGKLVVDPVRLAPVARLGGIIYGHCAELYAIPRPDKHGNYPAAASAPAPAQPSPPPPAKN